MFQKAEMVKYRGIAESFFNAVCNVYEYIENIKDGISSGELKLTLSDIPCRRGYATGGIINYSKTGDQALDNTEILQLVKLFLPADRNIKPGSFVKVIYGGCDEYYEYSGYTLKYDTHIEVLLQSVEGWA